jgi:tetraacyldisaccharide 4'-kinase
VRRHSAAPIFYATTELAGVTVLRDGRAVGAVPAEEWKQKRVFAFCGVGNPAAFFGDLRDWGFSVAGTADYPDHHHYTQLDATELETRARAHQAGALVCTEKDVFNLKDAKFSSTPVFVARIRTKVAEPERFCRALGRAIEMNRGGEAR